MTQRVVLGSIFVVATMVLLAIVGINEPARMAEFEAGFRARSIEAGAALFESNCKPCHGPQGEGLPAVAPALNTPALFDGTRLAEVGYAGTVEDFVRSTIASGRPVPSAGTDYPQRMPTWSQRFGGPLRDDQINNLVDFIMNWQTTAVGVAAGPAAPIVGVGADINTPELPAGDVANGEVVARAKGCFACHVDAAVGPAWLASADPNGQGVGTRAEARVTEADYSGAATDAAHYLREAIVQPNAYIVPGFSPDIMPKTYGDLLTAQDLADIIAYLESLK